MNFGIFQKYVRKSLQKYYLFVKLEFGSKSIRGTDVNNLLRIDFCW